MTNSKIVCNGEEASQFYCISFKNIFLMRSSLLIYSFMLIILIIPSSMAYSKQEVINKDAFCNCAIFRLDDIQEGELEAAQIDLLNLFISKNESLSLGLIMNSINDTQSPLIKKIVYGSQKNLFDLALHGLHHVDYTRLTAEEQKTTLEEGNKKMQQIFGEKSLIFIPPYNSFNSDTLFAMNQSGIKILSSMTDIEYNPIFVTKDKGNQFTDSYGIYHMPEMTSFENYTDKGQIVFNSINKILKNIYYDIAKYGYSVITLHPESFMKKTKGNSSEVIDANRVNDLSHIIDTLRSKNISITTFSEIIEKEGYNAQPIMYDEILNNKEHYGDALGVDAWSNYGDKLQDQANYTLSIIAYGKALQMDPNYVNALEGIGLSLSQLGNYTQAIPYYEKALRIDPNDIWSLTNKGWALSQLGNYTQAIPYFDKALGIDPNDIWSLTNKGWALNQLGNYTQAIPYFDKALKLNPTLMDALNLKREALQSLSNDQSRAIC